MRVLVGFALGLLASPVPATAGDSDAESLLRARRVGEAASRLEEADERSYWSRNPQALAEFCETSVRESESIIEAGTDGERFAAALDRVTAAAVEAHPDSVDALRARAHAALAWARVLTARGAPGAAERWGAVAAEFESVASRAPGTASPLCEAADAVIRGADAATEDPRPAFARADALLARVPADLASNPAIAARLAQVHLERARVSVRRRVPGAEDAIERAMAILGPAEALAPDDLRLGAAHNEAASTVRLLGLGRPKVSFAARPHRMASGVLMDVPLSPLWSESSGGGSASQGTPGRRPRRTLQFRHWLWSGAYKFGGSQDVKGASIKGIADGRFEEACAALKEVRVRSRPTRGSLKRCNPGWFFDVQGKDATGAPVRHRAWFFKATQGQEMTFEFSVLSHVEGDADDPEFQFVLDSIRETPKK